MYEAPHLPAEFKDLNAFSVIRLLSTDSQKNEKKPKSSIMHLAPDLNCVQIGEIVEFTEEKGDIEISKDGKVIEYNLENPSVVLVEVIATGEVISVVGETLNRNQDENGELFNQDSARNIVWDWYNGLVTMKALVGELQRQASGFGRQEKMQNTGEKMYASGEFRKSWHEMMLTYGTVFKRAFVGQRWRECRVVPNCYVRCSADLSQILYAPITCFQGDDKNAHLFLKDGFATEADMVMQL